MKVDRKEQKRFVGRRIVTAAVAVSMSIGAFWTLPTLPAHAATTNDLDIAVISARTEPRAFGGDGVLEGDPITEFKYIINVDNTGTTAGTTSNAPPQPGEGCYAGDAGYPDSCEWPSIKGASAPSPIYAQGDQDDFPLADLPDGRYLISVLADGYKLDGEHFTMPIDDSAPLTVELQPHPLPDSTIQAQVFADIAPTNGTPDVGDPPLDGFVGHISDTLGEVHDRRLRQPAVHHLRRRGSGHPRDPPRVASTGTCSPSSTSSAANCVSDADGVLTIPHLGTNRYALAVTPPDGADLDPDDHPRGQPRLGLLDHGGRHRVRHRVRDRRRALPAADLRLRARPPTTSRPGGSRRTSPASSSGSRHTRLPRAASFDFWNGGTGTKIDQPDRPARGSRCPTCRPATSPSGWDRATPTAASTSPACPTATTS